MSGHLLAPFFLSDGKVWFCASTVSMVGRRIRSIARNTQKIALGEVVRPERGVVTTNVFASVLSSDKGLYMEAHSSAELYQKAVERLFEHLP